MAMAQEIPAAAGAGVTAEMETQRSHWMVLRNSRLLVGLMYFGSLGSAFMAVCFALVALGELFPFHWSNLLSVLTCAAAALGSLSSVPWLWGMGRKMAHCEARLDSRGVDFRFGTKKDPEELFLPWEKVASIQRRRDGNNFVYTVGGSDGSEASFSSYTFFRPGRLAKLIAARTGVAIEHV